MRLVIVHIPKAAGTSLIQAIEEQLGANNIHSDYNRPLARSHLYRKVHCLVSSTYSPNSQAPLIFGHFLVGKYARFSGFNFIKRKGFRYVIFLRDPLQRAVSHYHFWKRTYICGHRVWEKFTREKWSLEKFLLSRQHTNFQSKFIWRFPLSQFDFIGLAEHYADSLIMLGCAFPILKGLRIRSEKSNPEKSVNADYRVDPDLASEFKRRNEIDYALYSQALNQFIEQKTRLLRDGRSR